MLPTMITHRGRRTGQFHGVILGLFVPALLFTVPSCAAKPSSNANPTVSEQVTALPDPPTTVSPEPTPEATPGVAIPEFPRKTYTLKAKSADGFRQTVTLKIGPAVLSTETGTLSSEWAASGGSGQIPCMDVDLPNDGSTGYVHSSEMAAYAFGEIILTNDVPDFAPQDWTVHFSRGESAADKVSAFGVGFSDASRCDGLRGGFRLTPSWEGDVSVWGPVPVVVAIADVRSPAHPLGEPQAMSPPLKMGFYDKEIDVYLTLAKS